MVETPRTESPAAKPARRKGRGVLWALLAVVLAFGAGYLWQWYDARGIREQLTHTEQELRIERLRVLLAQAAMAAQSGDFENARRDMSTFFTRLQARVDSLPPDLASLATNFLATRDDVITGLSRANPQYGAVLYNMLDRFQSAAAAQPPTATPSTPTAEPAAPESAVGEPGGGEPDTSGPPAGGDTTPPPES